MKIENIEKSVANLHDRDYCIIRIRSLKQVLDHELFLKGLHSVIKFNQKAWLKSYIDMNTNLIKAAKNYFEKKVFKLMNNSVFGKAIEIVRKHRDIKILTVKYRKNDLLSVPNYHITKLLSKKILRI